MCNQENERQEARGQTTAKLPTPSTRQRFPALLDKGPVNGRPLSRDLSAADEWRLLADSTHSGRETTDRPESTLYALMASPRAAAEAGQSGRSLNGIA